MYTSRFSSSIADILSTFPGRWGRLPVEPGAACQLIAAGYGVQGLLPKMHRI
jgi:hypothetical protein